MMRDMRDLNRNGNTPRSCARLFMSARLGWSRAVDGWQTRSSQVGRTATCKLLELLLPLPLLCMQKAHKLEGVARNA